MVAEGADLLDIGGESTRPGPRARSREAEELAPRRARSSRPSARRCPDVPLSIDTTKPAVAAAALDAGADLLNDSGASAPDDALAAARGRARRARSS